MILASSSPRRRELLASIGFEFDVVPSDVEEVRNRGENVAEYVLRLARDKAKAVASKHPDRWVIAADTVVWIDGEVLEKPGDQADAVRMLSRIAGRQHTVYTAVALRHDRLGREETGLVDTRVTMTPMTRGEMQWYAATGEPLDKAGSYAVQGIGAMFIEAIDGNYTNVVGLPLSLLVDMMRRAGIDPLEESRARNGIACPPE